MTDEAMIEAMARALWGDEAYRPVGWEVATTAALTELKQEIRREAFEEAAKMVEGYVGHTAGRDVFFLADAVLALSERPDPAEETNSV
jgi:hypothetical protein